MCVSLMVKVAGDFKIQKLKAIKNSQLNCAKLICLLEVERKSSVASTLLGHKTDARLIKSILLVLFLCAISIQTLSQKLTTTVELPKNKWSLEEVLTYLSQHYHVQFSFVKENIATSYPIIIPAKPIKLNDLIIEISKQADLEFRLLSDQIVLRKNRYPSTGAHSEIILADIEGTVTDSLTHLPLAHANVYLNHTTFGTATDENGTFLLKNIPIGKYEFIFSYVGYKTMIYPLTLKPERHVQFAVKLLPMAKELKSVIITPKRDKAWQKNFDLFKRELLGNTTNSRLCSIINPEAVNLTKSENILWAEASEPIEIENRALGYKIYLTLKKFAIGSEDYYLEFNSHFEPLQSTNDAEQLRWELNRLNSYGGSEMHLFRSILDHRSWPEGFSIYKQNLNPVLDIYNLAATSNYTIPFNDKTISLDPAEDNLAVVFEKGKYLITYEKKMLSQGQQTVKGATHATSIIEVNSATLKVDSRGATILPHDYIRTGFINTHRIADKLPSDYDPEKSRKKIYSYHLNKLGFIEGIVIDSITKKPISGADVFINFSTSHTKTNEDGEFRLQEIGLGVYDVVISKFDYTIKHYNLIADSIQRQMNTFALSDKPFHNLNTTEQFHQLSNSTRVLVRESEISKFKKYLHSSQNILNEQLVTIRIDEENNGYYDSYFPLEVIDNKVGYRINIFLEKDHSPDHVANKVTLPPRASCYYENIDTFFKGQNKELMRLEAYDGSPLHFLKSLRYGRSIEEGFSIYKDVYSASVNKRKPLSEKVQEEIFPANLVYTKSIEGTTVDLPEWIQVHYSLPTSSTTRIFRLHIPHKRILFATNGSISTNVADITLESGTSAGKLIPRLPIDYRPPKESPLNSF